MITLTGLFSISRISSCGFKPSLEGRGIIY